VRHKRKIELRGEQSSVGVGELVVGRAVTASKHLMALRGQQGMHTNSNGKSGYRNGGTGKTSGKGDSRSGNNADRHIDERKGKSESETQEYMKRQYQAVAAGFRTEHKTAGKQTQEREQDA
jgi:hypothetical protein